MTPIVRFAPSPTGRLHIGNVRTAVLNYLLALRHGGKFILRLDDTDRERSTEAFADAIRDDLAWLGLMWEREVRQSERTGCYEAAASRLAVEGRLYPCFESEEELGLRRKCQLAMGHPPIYDRSSLKLSPEERAHLKSSGRAPHWRFRLDNLSPGTGLAPQPTLVSWNDMVRGDQAVDVGSMSDPVVVRGDGTFLYTFTSVVDDIELGITHILRGEDHVTNTGVQIQIFEALGADPPVFGHHSLLVGADGQALSKRLGALSVASFRESGLEPMAVVSHAALVGTSDAIEPHVHMAELAALFDPSKISMSPGRFDVADLEALNAKLLHKLPYGNVAKRLAALGVGGGEAFWMAVRGNIRLMTGALDWWHVAHEPIHPVIEDQAFTLRAAALLPAEPWDEGTWGAWTAAVKEATGAKGRALFHPLRLALTGREEGPELRYFLPFIGRRRSAARLAGSSA